VTHVLLISHLSFLTKAFDAQPYDNCEFRAFDFFYDGTFSRCYKKIIPTILVIDTITEIDKILATAEISCQINGVEFSQKCNLSDLRSSLHHLVKKSLSEKEYNQNFPTSFPSVHKFPTFRTWKNG